MSSHLAKELIREVEAEWKRYSSQRGSHDPEINYQEMRDGVRLWTTEYPRVQVVVDFSKAPIFAEVLYVHTAALGKSKDWTNHIFLKFDAGERAYFVYGDERYDTMGGLSQELLSPLMDFNFKPPER